jgi:Trypsin-like peptidase domain
MSLIENLAKRVVRVDNLHGSTGTGFLVMRRLSETSARVFLVTNKHVVWGDDFVDLDLVEEIELSFTAFWDFGQGEQPVRGNSRVPLSLLSEKSNLRAHPDPDVDVVAIDVTSLIVAGQSVTQLRSIGYELFLTEAKKQEHEVTVGDAILAIGYPETGIRHLGNHYPFVRQGIIASYLGHMLEDKIVEPQTKRERTRQLRAFMVDGAIVPGSSGAPVFLDATRMRHTSTGYKVGGTPPLLLGIIAEARKSPVKGSRFEGLTYAGLGMAFEAETIRETIELFFPDDPTFESILPAPDSTPDPA